MAHSVNTKSVEGRRKLRFDTLADIEADLEKLTQAKRLRTLGNWTVGQILGHLAVPMNGAIDGMKMTVPWHMRLMMLFMRPFKSKFLNGAMPAGYKLPASAEKSLIPPPNTSIEEGLASVRRGLERLKKESHREPSPFMGPMTREEWDKLTCRHCELHLSFILPENK